MNLLIGRIREFVFEGGSRVNLRAILLLVGSVGMFTAVGIGFLVKARDQANYDNFLHTVAYLDAVKGAVTLDRKLTNGYPITLQDLAPYLGKEGAQIILSCVVSKEGTNEMLRSVSNDPWVYILNPVGTPTKGRLLHGMAGHPAGAEISAPYANFMLILRYINNAKRFAAGDHHWSKGYPITVEDIPQWASELTKSNDYYFILNPVGLPTKAHLLRPFEGLPAGTEISWENR